jgi:hypothetical protein
MLTPRPTPTRLATLVVAAACVAALSACTSSGSTSKSGSPSGSTSASGTSGTSGTSSTTSSGATGSSSSGSGKSGHAPGKPLATQIIQGSHLTYNIDIWARETAPACDKYVTGAKITALVRGKPCTLTRIIATTKVDGKALGVSEATLKFGGSPAAAARTATQVAVPAAAPDNAVNSAGSVTAVRTWYLSGRTTANDPRLSEAVEDLSTI